ncbi:unnamed protein product, partial [Meganyctiphanes norvegica]
MPFGPAMKIIILSAVVAVALAAPQFEQNPNGAFRNVRYETNGPVEAEFQWAFETDNGISANANGVAGSNGQSNHDGAFSFTHDDGTQTNVQYIANEFGYQPVGLTPHVADLLRIAQEQQAQGIEFDQRGFRIN